MGRPVVGARRWETMQEESQEISSKNTARRLGSSRLLAITLHSVPAPRKSLSASASRLRFLWSSSPPARLSHSPKPAARPPSDTDLEFLGGGEAEVRSCGEAMGTEGCAQTTAGLGAPESAGKLERRRTRQRPATSAFSTGRPLAHQSP